MNEKVRHVLRASQSRRHHCHWPGCDKQVPPAVWGCKPHWYKLPQRLRNLIWAAYSPGQEERMDPSDRYIAAANEVQIWIAGQAGASDQAAPSSTVTTKETNVSATDTLALVKQYATEHDQPADLMDRVLSDVSDDRSIPLKIYGGLANFTGEVRQVLDPQRVTIKNVKGTRARAIDIGPGTTLVYGGNDVGKTTILKAILYAIGGSSAAGVKSAEDLMTHGAGEMEVQFEFFGGVIRRGCTRRVIKKGKAAGTTEVVHTLTAQIGGDKADKPAAAQALIDGWLGVDSAFVRRVACLEQGALTEIMDEQPARRRELFYRLLSLEAAEDTRKSLSVALQQQEDILVNKAKHAEERAGRLESLKRRLAQYPVAVLEQKRTDLAPMASAGAASEQELRQAKDAHTRRTLDLATARRGNDQRREYTAKLEELKRDPAIAADVHDTDLVARLQITERAVSEGQAVLASNKAQLAELTRKGTEIKNLPPTCPTCLLAGKVCDVTPETKNELLAHVRAAWSVASRELAANEEQLGTHVVALTQLRATVAQMQRNADRRLFLGQQISMVEKAVADLPVHLDTAAIEADCTSLLEALKALEQRGGNTAAADLATVDRALAEARALQAQIMNEENGAKNEVDVKQMPPADLEAFRWLVKAFAKDGIPLWLARQHVARVNTIAYELAGVDRYRYSFGDDLEIRVHDGTSVTGPELASGSSRERGAVVLMAALGRYLQELSGLSIPFLWIDELPFQDDANQHLVVEMVRRLTQWYPKVILCASRWDDLTGKFDNEIALLPEQVSSELDRQREATKVLKEQGQGMLAPPPPPVKTYDISGATASILPDKMDALRDAGEAEQFVAQLDAACEKAGPPLVDPFAAAGAAAAVRAIESSGPVGSVDMRQRIVVCDVHALLLKPNEVAVNHPGSGPCVRCSEAAVKAGGQPLPGVDIPGVRGVVDEFQSTVLKNVGRNAEETAKLAAAAAGNEPADPGAEGCPF